MRKDSFDRGGGVRWIEVGARLAVSGSVGVASDGKGESKEWTGEASCRCFRTTASRSIEDTM